MLQVRLVLFWMIVGAWAGAVQAAPTPAATVISNVVTLDYSASGIPSSITSAPASFTVQEKIDLVLTAGPTVSVNSPDTDRTLSFILTNTGNGTESFSLVRNNALPGDNFDPANGTSGSMFIDTNNNGIYDPGTDTAYTPAGITFTAGESRRILVLSDIPSPLSNGNIGLVSLTASSMTPGAAGQPAGTVIANGGDGGAIDAVVGLSQAQQTRTGTYLVSGLVVSVSKTVLSPPALVQPGSELTYQVSVTISGTGTATGLVVNDPLPAELTFVPASIVITAPDGDDTALFSTNTVTVNFGDTAAPATRIFTFRATVN